MKYLALIGTIVAIIIAVLIQKCLYLYTPLFGIIGYFYGTGIREVYRSFTISYYESANEGAWKFLCFFGTMVSIGLIIVSGLFFGTCYLWTTFQFSKPIICW